MAVDMTLCFFERVADNGLNMLESFEIKKGGRVAPACPKNKDPSDVRRVLEAVSC